MNMSMRKEHSSDSNTELTRARVTSGPPVSPADRIKLYSADQWEEFIKEWGIDSVGPHPVNIALNVIY